MHKCGADRRNSTQPLRPQRVWCWSWPMKYPKLPMFAVANDDETVAIALVVLIVVAVLVIRFVLARRSSSRKSAMRTTSDGRPPHPGFENASAPSPADRVTGQNASYWVLSQEERAKGFVRPVRFEYWHERCGTITSMMRDIAETFARDPKFYGTTFCIQCRGQFATGRNGQFFWMDGDEVTNERVGT